MAYNSVIYPLLRVKMAEISIDVKTIAEGIGMSRETLSRKFSGRSEPTLREGRQIRDKYFPGVKLEDLFDSEYQLNEQTA